MIISCIEYVQAIVDPGLIPESCKGALCWEGGDGQARCLLHVAGRLPQEGWRQAVREMSRVHPHPLGDHAPRLHNAQVCDPTGGDECAADLQWQ